jgi:hypothetical protein
MKENRLNQESKTPIFKTIDLLGIECELIFTKRFCEFKT